MEVEIRTLPEMKAAAVHHVGPYPEIGKAFGQAAAWAREKGIPFEANFIGIYYDDPSRTPPAELQSDACVLVPETMDLTGEPLSEVRIQGGTYAVTTHVGSYDKLGESWMKFYSEGLAKLGKWPIGPGIEIYLDDCDKTPIDQVRTEIAVPIG